MPVSAILSDREIAPPEMTAALLDSLRLVETMRYIPEDLEMDAKPVIKQILGTLGQLDEIWTTS
jgi:hypothetical protein